MQGSHGQVSAGAAMAEGLILGVICGPARAGAWDLGCLGAAPGQPPVHGEARSNGFPLPFTLGWRGRSVFPW